MEPAAITTSPATLLSTSKPLFWSYHFSSLNTVDDKKTIMVQLLNCGTLAIGVGAAITMA
jgi:hypothetical protein